jgi:heat-inducible transcriptional repressor
VVSQISSLTSIVSSPRVSQIRLREIQLTWLSSHRVLVLVITEDGRVFNRVGRLRDPVASEDLSRMQKFLSELVVGHTLREVRRRVRAQLKVAENQYRHGVRRALEIGQEALEEAARSELFVEGALQFLEYAEFSRNIERVRGLLRTLEDRERVLEVLDGLCDSESVQTLIGPELGGAWGGDLSLIACGYSQDGRQAGLVGVLGPIRMDYARIIPLVEHAAGVLSKELEDLA